MERSHPEARPSSWQAEIRRQDPRRDRRGTPRLMLYLDTSALVKKYVHEPRSAEVHGLISREHMIATSAISRAEAAAAFSKATRIGSLTSSTAQACHRAFRREWKNYIRIRVTEALVA